MKNPNAKNKHSHVYGILLIGLTALSFILNAIFYLNEMPEFLDFSLLVTVLVITLLLILDRESLKNCYPNEKIFTGISVILVPWYLYARAKFLGHKQGFLFIWATIVAIGILTNYWIEKSHSGLPACHDTRVTEWLGEMVGNSVISLTDIEEISFEEVSEARVCKSILTQKDDDIRRLYYTVYWENRDRSYYMIEILPRWIYE